MQNPNLRELKELALYLEGLHKGQGNILPLGKSHIDSLWSAINKLSHDDLKQKVLALQLPVKVQRYKRYSHGFNKAIESVIKLIDESTKPDIS